MPEEDKNMLNTTLVVIKVIKSSIYNLCRFRMYTKKRVILPNNPEHSYTERKVKHKSSGYSWSLIYSFDKTKNQHNFYRKKDCIEKLCKDLKERAMEIINYKQKEMITLTYK